MAEPQLGIEGINPLDDRDCDCLNAVLESGTITDDFLQRCHDCGLKVDDAIKQNKAQMDMAKAVKRMFFSNKI